MLSSEAIEYQKVVFKIEPTDSFEQDSYQDVSTLTAKSEFLRQPCQQHCVASGGHGSNETQEDECDKGFDNSSEISETVKIIKRSNSSSIDLNTVFDGSAKELSVNKDGNINYLYEETIAHPHGHGFTYSSESPNCEKSADLKPSRKELEIYSRDSSKLNLAQRLYEHRDVSPLTHYHEHSDVDSDHVRTDGCKRGSQGLSLVTPDTMLFPKSHTQLPGATPTRQRHTIRSSLEKEGSYSNKNFSDSEIMKLIVNKDGTTTCYRCESCHKVFNKRQTLRQHFVTHTNRFACPYCDTRSKSKGDLSRHIQTHTKEKPYHCGVCNTNYTRKSILKKHMKTQLHLRASFEHGNFADLCNVVNNIEKNGDKVPIQTKCKLGFSCSLCKKVTFSRAEYRKHTRSHAFKYICNICQKGCKSPLLLTIHRRSHNWATNLSCKVCSRTFANLYGLKNHFKSHRSGNSSKVAEEILYKASVIKSKDTAKMKFQSHLSSNSTLSRADKNISAVVRKFECDDCNKTFASKRYLTNHTCVHDETYVCGVCTKTYPNLSKLKIHLKLHERILKCAICEMTFHEDKELEDHVQGLHVVANDYTCRLCYDHFDRASDLENHMNDHGPTMLFSGRSLEESSLSGVNKTEMKSLNAKKDLTKGIKMEALSDKEEVKVFRRQVKVDNLKSTDSDDDSILGSKEFYEILNNAVDGSDNKFSDIEISDSDEELYSGIKTVLENGVITHDESDKNESEKLTALRKPLVYGHGDIVKKHGSEFKMYSGKDVNHQALYCKLCGIIFHEERYLRNHLKHHHVCEYCNTFFRDRDNLSAHKSHHVKQLLKQIKMEAQRLCVPLQKLKGYHMASPESENGLEDQILNEIEDVFDGEPLELLSPVNFLLTLSHDEIVQTNKHFFEKHSFLDPDNNIFACTICKRKYARPTTLTRHFKTHVCQFCNKFFKDKSDLPEHKYSHHKKTSPIKAEITGEEDKIPSSLFVSKPNREMFKKYSFIDVDKNVFRCTLCHKDYVRSVSLTRHLKTHICSHCHRFFENKYDLIKHVRFLHVKRKFIENKAADCDELTENDEGEKDASASSTDDENVGQDIKNIALLPLCPLPLAHVSQSFQVQPSGSNSNETMQNFHLPSTVTSKSESKKVFSVPDYDTSFQIISQPIRVYKNIAQQSLSVASPIKDDSKPKQIMKIPRSQTLSTSTEERERPFECGECRKRFLKNNHLRSHMTIHTGDRPFICCLCNKAFGRYTILQKHMRTHMKQCKICQVIFAHKYELDFHMEAHRTYTFYK